MGRRCFFLLPVKQPTNEAIDPRQKALFSPLLMGCDAANQQKILFVRKIIGITEYGRTGQLEDDPGDLGRAPLVKQAEDRELQDVLDILTAGLGSYTSSMLATVSSR